MNRYTKPATYTASGIAFVVGWSIASIWTVKGLTMLRDYGDRKAQDARAWALTKLDAPTDIVISQPESQQTLDTIIDREAAAQHVSSDLVRALISVESTYRQDAIAFNPEGDAKYGKMKSAAHSYMQVRGTWAGSEICPEAKTWSDLYNATTNVRCGIRIMKEALATQPSLRLAMAQYNGGAQCISKGQIVCEESRSHSSKVLEQLAEIVWRKQ